MKNRKTWLALLLVLALMLCLLPAAALAAGNGNAEDAEEPSEETAVEEPGETAEETAAADDDLLVDEAEVDEAEVGVAAEDGEAVVLDFDVTEVMAEGEVIVADAEDEVFALAGDTVYNNGGVVYSNGATVYNNAGLVYNNAGLVYNNAGSVYSNGGTVYNNAGSVYSNGATVYSFAGSVEEAVIYGYYRVTLTGDFEDYAEVDGLITEGESGELLVTADAVVTITAKAGYALTGVQADAGVLTENEDGSYSLTDVDAALTLDIKARPEAPVLSLAPGSYGEAQTLEITAVDGAEIYYSTDGRTPDADNSELYEAPIEITEGVTVTAVAVVKGLAVSESTQARYAVVTLAAPSFDSEEEGYRQPVAQAVTAENPGSVDAVVTAVSLTGDDADCFTLLGSARGGTIKAGAGGDTQWKLRPTAGLEKGRYSATLVFTFDSGETAELRVSFRVK